MPIRTLSTVIRSWLTIAGAMLFALGATGINGPATAAEQRELVLLNWSEYMDPELLQKFEQQYGVKVREVLYESDEERDKMMIDSEGKGYDLVLLSGLAIKAYVKRGWLASLNKRNLPNLRHIDPQWRAAHEQAESHAVPYFWGTLGIAYRSDLVSQPVTSWKQFFQPAEEMRGRIAVINDTRDLVGMTLRSLGHSLNTNDENALVAAEVLLQEQQPYVGSYDYISTLDENSELVTGQIWATMAYNGDALMVREHNEDIQYVVPTEGSALWVDYLAVLESSSKKDLAWSFINFLNEPRNAAQLAEYVWYATPNKAAREFLPAEILEDELIYPDEATLARSEFYEELPPRVLRSYAGILARVVR
jgi:spermidine/putrescine transport system substrate-binding protein